MNNIFNNPGFNNFGYFVTNDHAAASTKNERNVKMLTNALGYLPFVGRIVGICRIVLAVNSIFKRDHIDKAFLAHSMTQIARGTVEAFASPLLLIIPDLIVTIGREVVNYQNRTTGTNFLAKLPF